MRSLAAQTIGKRGRPLSVSRRYVIKVRQLIACGASYADIRRRFHLNKSLIDRIVNHKCGYEHVSDGDVRCKR